MSSRTTPERNARLCDDARRLLERTAEHGELVEALVTAAERTASTAISARYYESPATIDVPLHELDDCARLNVQAARQLRVSARQQHVAAAELLKDLDSGAPPLVAAPMTVLVVDASRPSGISSRTSCATPVSSSEPRQMGSKL